MVVFLSSCRTNLERKASESYRHAEEIGVVLRRLDSLSSTIAERQRIKIEFYEPQGPEMPNTGKESLTPAAPSATCLGNASPTGSVGGGVGAVKSIEITKETEASTHSNTLTDSSSVFKTDDAATRQEDKKSEIRQDNGTVLIVAVAAAVVFLLALLIIIRKLFPK